MPSYAIDLTEEEVKILKESYFFVTDAELRDELEKHIKEIVEDMTFTCQYLGSINNE